MPVDCDSELSDNLFRAITSGSEIPNEEKLQYIKFLTDYYVSKAYGFKGQSKTLGFLRGKVNTFTNQLKDLDYQTVMKIKDTLERDFSIYPKFEKDQDTQNFNVLFDADLE